MLSENEKAADVVAWITFVLVMKNVVLLILSATLRYRSRISRTPEDQKTMNGEHCVNEKDNWSTSGRINRCLRNDVKYFPYF